jgi:trehalose 6-phosphate synthase/phosphatase
MRGSEDGHMRKRQQFSRLGLALVLLDNTAMDIISYRGPGVAGGVSSGLTRVWQTETDSGSSCWWFLDGELVKALPDSSDTSRVVGIVDAQTIQAHYRYCNEFLWPLMHDLPQHVRYNAADRESYRNFNIAIARTIGDGNKRFHPTFVQDYQLALLPSYMQFESSRRCLVFWHIPWPRNVLKTHIEPLMEIARGLLTAERIGFHTTEYAQNFMRFVRDNMPGYTVEEDYMFVRSYELDTELKAIESRRQSIEQKSPVTGVPSYINRPIPRFRDSDTSTGTLISVQPFGIDYDYWANLEPAPDVVREVADFGIDLKKPFVLSVDRADYTKGVKERIRAIDAFFTKYPEQRGKITFVQFCGRTRTRLAEFDRYWDECHESARVLNSRLAQGKWTPLLWIEQSVSALHLSVLYSRAQIMFITPVRDGLNLTAKEFVACQKKHSGVLLLSPGAGVWQELSQHALRVDCLRPDITADTIAAALKMGGMERRRRMTAMQEIIKNDSLHLWWTTFSGRPSLPVGADKRIESIA